MDFYQLETEMIDGKKTVTWVDYKSTDRRILYIPADIDEFRPLILNDFDPLAIVVDPENKRYTSRGSCLIDRIGNKREVIMICSSSVLPQENVDSLTLNQFFNLDIDFLPKDEDGNTCVTVPEGVRELGFHCFHTSVNGYVCICLPSTLEYLAPLSLDFQRIDDDFTFLLFHSDPEIAPGAFGSKAELKDCKDRVLRNMPARICANPKRIIISAPIGSSNLRAYCRKYGMIFEEDARL